MKILIIESDYEMAKLVAQGLANAAYEPIVSTDAIQGLNFVHTEKPDLIILDLFLPAGGGLSILERIKGSPNTSNIPVLVITNEKDNEYKNNALEMGAIDYLEKPYDLNALIKIIEKIPVEEKIETKNKILIIEDDKDLIKLMMRKLIASGYVVSFAEDTYQAMALVEKEKPDLIILDLLLPGGGGLTFLERLKKTTYAFKIPVIVLTGVKDNKYKEEVLKIGVADYLEKPFKEEILLSSIKKTLKDKVVRKKEMSKKIIVYIDPEIKDLVPDFLKNRGEDLKSLYIALEKEDYENIQKIGHKMKGSGGSYGFDGLTEIGGSLEQAAKEKKIEDIKIWIDKLSFYLENLEIRINE
uniref:Response regulator n=1 Tax=candidate division WOR-3 bacterium TaxID=2052148 RepID=A0A7C4Y6M7_UNCW3